MATSGAWRSRCSCCGSRTCCCWTSPLPVRPCQLLCAVAVDAGFVLFPAVTHAKRAGLDWRARNELVALLQRLKQQVSLLVVSHDLRELAPIVDTAWEMHVGGTLEHRGKDIPVTRIASAAVEVA